MHRLVFGINFFYHFVNLILIILLHTLLISRMPVHFFHHHQVYHPSPLLFFTPGSKPTLSEILLTVDC